MLTEKYNKESFLICQFQSLMNHIDNLISSSTMRVYSLLIIWAFTISAVTLMYSNDSELSEFRLIVLSTGLFLLMIGIYFYYLQIKSSVQIVYYYRILNRIRTKYMNIYTDLDEILFGLLFSEKEPRNAYSVFDPGIFIVLILNSASLLLVIRIIWKLIFAILIVVLAFIFQILFWKLYERKKLAKLTNAKKNKCSTNP